MVEDHCQLGQRLGEPAGGVQVRGTDEDLENEARIGGRAKPATDVRPAEPPDRIRLVVDWVTDADEPPAARGGAQRGQPVGDVRRRQVGPADHARHQPVARLGRREQLEGLVLNRRGLHRDRGRRAGRLGNRPQRLNAPALPEARERPGHPGVVPPVGVPEVVVRVDDHRSAPATRCASADGYSGPSGSPIPGSRGACTRPRSSTNGSGLTVVEVTRDS